MKANPVKARRLAFAFVLGAATVPAFAPFYFHALSLVTLAAFAVLLLNTDSTRAAVATGFAFGLGLLLTGTSWVYVSLHVYGGMAVPAAAFATFVFCAIYASCPAIAGGLVHRLRAGQGLTLLLVFPALWALSDWSRGWLFTGFPWLSLGYSQVPSSPLAGYAPVVGVYGVSLFTALTAGAIALAWLRVSQLVRSPQTQAAGLAPPDHSASKWRRALASGIAPAALAIAVARSAFGSSRRSLIRPEKYSSKRSKTIFQVTACCSGDMGSLPGRIRSGSPQLNSHWVSLSISG